MRLHVPTEFVPAVLSAAAISAAALLGTFTYVVAQATEQGAVRSAQAAQAAITAGPKTKTARASP